MFKNFAKKKMLKLENYIYVTDGKSKQVIVKTLDPVVVMCLVHFNVDVVMWIRMVRCKNIV